MPQGGRSVESSTIEGISIAYKKSGSYRRTAAALHVPYTLIRDIVKGKHAHVSRASENRVRVALGLSDLPSRVEVDPCPDCGSVHTGRCHGRAVAVLPVRRRRPLSRWADAPTSVLAAAIRERVELAS